MELSSTHPTTDAYLYRFKLSSEETWTYCDLDGSGNGFQTDQMGEVTVEEPEVSIDWCNLQHPATMTVEAGEETPTVYGRVHAPGCTTDSPDMRIECEKLTGQVGWGPTPVDPSTDPGMYDWNDATYNDQFPPKDMTNDNDEYQTTFTTPNSAGTHHYVFRFSSDGGSTWTYCDLDGPPFSTDQLGTITVE